jgi:nitroreductase
MRKPAVTAYPIDGLLAERWSPRAFAETPITDAEIGALLEAARWAASCYNDQPWRFVVGRRGAGDGWQRLFDTLTPGNRAWCARVPVLMLSVAVGAFRHNGAANRHAQHDVGMASAQLALQASSMGLAVHLMAGFDRERAREALAIPDGCEPMAMIALGRPDLPDVLPEPLRARELAPRQRLGLDEIAFAGAWGLRLALT